ncbi:LytTR family DNA-binding domain-containing protein [Candidatus Parabeggiatoa sp. HSG14]|uniref:LytR/AlgR family response regulator transcription factor n=1 Tax=Candidatus Parabeggiatoa sp. HSG14 TaxID=3055593 RepID=UPI0025A7E757|nr:LytTR family DNA-binding domain-containing protein [Thiotrichales bacterium HSG14]
MKIIIADDEPLARDRLRALVRELGMGKVVAMANNGMEVLFATRAYQPDIVLLDIHMPGMDGMQTAKQLALLHPTPVVIFTTAYEEYAVEAFEHQAVDYLMKPIRKERLEQALKRAYDFIQTPSNQPLTSTPTARTHISHYRRGELHLVPVNQIYYFFSHQKYIVLRWVDGEALISEALRDLEQEFAGQFLRIHRSTLVAMIQIAGLIKKENGRSYIQLKDISETLEVSRRHLQTVKTFVKDMRISSQI